MEKMKDISERETMLFTERDIQTVVGASRLELKIEGAAETLAKGEPPGFVDAAAERSMDDELHAAAFVEETLGDDRALRRNGSQQRAASHDVFNSLFGARIIEAALEFEPVHRGSNTGGSLRAGVLRDGARDKRADLLA